MSGLLSEIIELSITGSYVFLFVMLIRLLIRKAPRKFSYYLWLVFWIRLVIPKSVNSVFSIFNYTKNTPAQSASNFENIVYPELVDMSTNSGSLNNAAAETAQNVIETAKSVNPMGVVLWSAWIAGIAFILIYSLIVYVKLVRNVESSSWYKGNIYINRNVDSPFVIGLFKPRIYMPKGLGDEEFKYILMHEQVHIMRHDHIIKIICYLILALHWFNPLAWIAFVLMSKDIEISCDEKVLEKLGTGIKKQYSYSLLNMSLKEKLAPVPIAFGQSNAKERIKRVMNYKKTQPIIVVLIVIILAASGCALLSNPIDNGENEPAVIANEPTNVPAAEAVVETPEITNEAVNKYDGLSGVDLYNAVMTEKYYGKIKYTVEASNDYADIKIVTYRENGNFNELFSETGEDTYVTIYIDDENMSYSYIEDSEEGKLYKYEQDEDGYKYHDQHPLDEEQADNLVESKIIDFNGRETYYYEMHFENKGNDYTEVYVNKYWIDAETKVQMKAEFYMDDYMIANSAVTEMTDDFDSADLFTPPADVEFTCVEE